MSPKWADRPAQVLKQVNVSTRQEQEKDEYEPLDEDTTHFMLYKKT